MIVSARQAPPASISNVDRRAFVGRCACALAALAVGGCASLATRPVTPVNGRFALALVHYPELLEPNGSLRVMPAGHPEPVYIMALGENRFRALSPICTHLGCTVDIQDDRLVCPCHGSTYDRTGAVLRGPAEHPLAHFRTELSADGVLTVDLQSRS